MVERKNILHELDLIGQQMRELEIHYEKYFSGEEKREPLKKREDLYRKLRQFSHRRIIQTDLRFRYESLTSRYYSYATHWDRILRLMDEGKYVRHLARNSRPSSTAATAATSEKPLNESDKVYQQLLKAHQECAPGSPPPDRQKFAAFLAKQRSALESKYGGREVEFRVVTEDGKPKIKVKAKE